MTPQINSENRYAVSLARTHLIVRDGMRGDAAVSQMAEDMRTIAASKGNVTESDLTLLGWTASQVTMHNANARARAIRQSVRVVT